MAEQETKMIFWDRHEAALLIDLCSKVRDGKIKRAEGIEQLSAKLKRRAELMGRKVDRNFRSVGSLAKHYSMAEYLVTDGLRGEPRTAPIFASVYRTFVSEPDEFKKILAEAERQCRQRVFEFDTHEVIKLVEASVKMSGRDDVSEVAANLSTLFKDYASRRGVSDDDNSRDADSIARRLAVIDGLRRGRQVDSAAPREVFLVKLYKFDPDKFNALLLEANKALGIETVLPPPDFLVDILKTQFPSGFKFNSSIARKQLRRAIGEDQIRYITDDQLVKALREITVERGEKFFLPYTPEQQKLIDEIQATVDEILSRGYSCVYVDKLFERYSDRLMSTARINSVLELMERQGWEKNVLGTPNIGADVQKFFSTEHRPITLSELERELWFIPFEKLKTAASASLQVVAIKPDTYMDIDAFPLDADERLRAEELIKNALQSVPSITLEECRRIICKEFPRVERETADYTTQGFGGVMRGLFGRKFSFNRNLVSAANEIVSKRQLFIDYCNEREEFTLDELQAFAEEINSQIEFKSVRKVAVRISATQFIRRDQIHFNVEAIDEGLNKLIVDCRSIKSLAMHFKELPPLFGYEWNEYILESYLFCFSEQFELINSVFSKLSWGGAAGRKSLHLEFEDVAEKILAKSKRWKDRESALDLLVSEKILLRRAFKDIDEVIRRLRADFD